MNQWDENRIHCAAPGCLRKLPNHYWGKVKSDWFFQKDGNAWCPDHTPDWVAEWRHRGTTDRQAEQLLTGQEP